MSNINPNQLPITTKDPFLITTPLFYVNAKPHMGSAYTTMAVDALHRFYHLLGMNSILLTGCDEHGEKIAQAALTLNRDPQSHCDLISNEFIELWKLLNISKENFKFIRTTSDHHQKIVKEFFTRVWNNGDIYKSEYNGIYCTGCEEYKDKTELISNDLCPIHQKQCIERTEENYFFALSKYQRVLEEFYEQNPDFILPLDRRNEVKAWMKSGLRDFSVSRAQNPWGIPVPQDDSQTIYVWFDALVGYLSGLLEPNMTLSDLMETKSGWPAQVHVIGKDILRFHALYWPAMLISAGLPVPERIFGHGFLTKDGMKMGKSLGNVLEPNALIDSYGSDAVRYYFLKTLEFGKDGDFNETRFVDLINADLANSLGNLMNRSLNLLKKNCQSTFTIGADEIEHDHQLRILTQECVELSRNAYLRMDFSEACSCLMKIVYEANAEIDRIAPWTLLKSEETRKEAEKCLVCVLEAARIVSTGLSPIVPELNRRVYAALGFDDAIVSNLEWKRDLKWGFIKKSQQFPVPKPIFPRIDTKT